MSGCLPIGMDPNGSHQVPSGLRHDISPPNVSAMNVMSLNPLAAAGFGFGVPGGPPGGLLSPMHSNSSGMYQPSPMVQSISPGAQLYLSTGQSHHPSSSFTPPQPGASSLHCASPYSPMQSPGIGTSGSGGYQMSGPGLNGIGSKLGGGRHLCAICEDAASGKHYGVYR